MFQFENYVIKIVSHM